MAIYQVAFVGRNGAGPVSVPGTHVGDVMLSLLCPSIDSSQRIGGNLFESQVSVQDQIQQNSTADFSMIAWLAVLENGASQPAGPIQVPSYLVANLPSASSSGQGAAAFVPDSNQTLAAGVGTAVVGGGTNKVPVYSDGTNWIIG